MIGFDQLVTFIHQRGAIDGDFGAHVPIGMIERLRLGDVLHLRQCMGAERAAGCGEEDFFHLRSFAALQALEHGAMFAIDRSELAAIFLFGGEE